MQFGLVPKIKKKLNKLMS